MSIPLTVDAFLERPDAGAAGEVTISVGTPFSLVIEARHAPGQIALLPEALDLGPSLGERTFARVHRRGRDAEVEVDTYRLELVPFEAGDLTIPEIPLAVGSTVSKTPALVVTVDTTFTAEELPVATSTEPAALAALEEMAAGDPPPRRVDVFDATLLWAVAIAALLGLLGYLWLRRKRRPAAPRPEAPPAPARPAHEVALYALDALKAQDLMATGGFKEHYTELSMILREYVGRRYGFESLELTLEELLDALRGRASKELEVDTLMAILASADHVKFAKRVPTLGDGYEDLDRARRIVTRSTPEPSATASPGHAPDQGEATA